MRTALAFDFGASSGRATLCSFDGEKITLREVHRFENTPVYVRGTLYWDILRLFHEIKQGIAKAQSEGGFDSIGIDTWGVDFGILDSDGVLTENPVCYRDGRTNGLSAEAVKILGDELYSLTGNQIMDINTAFQLYSLAKNRPAVLERGETLLMLPDLFGYLLTGVKSTEKSIASTTQLFNQKTGEWAFPVMEQLGIPKRLFTEVVNAGSIKGVLSEEICRELNVPPAKVIAVCSHDTQSAVAAVPAKTDDFAFISCGTWSLFGTELKAPDISERAARLNITNESGFGGTTTFLKNIIGLWLIQEARREWRRQGYDYSYAELERQALSARPLTCFIDPDAPEFVPPGDIPSRVQEFCRRTGQKIPTSVGQIMRCIYESLAMKYRYALNQLEECSGKRYPVIHLVGGGTKDGLLCSMTADSCNREVIAGPVEATVYGNAAVQLIATGDIKDLSEARRIIAASDSVKHYTPENTAEWEEKYPEFLKIIKGE